jgi:4-hydroxybenzoate polyprenyltransferase
MTPKQSIPRAVLVLGRASNLPTVWTNCAAAWLIAGGALTDLGLAFACLAGTLCYLGGTTLNDAFDVEFDRKHRTERPIPAGVLGAGTVWALGIGYLAAGMAVWHWGTGVHPALPTALVACIVLYDWLHKKSGIAGIPLMGGCRALLFLAAASAAGGDTGMAKAAPWALVLAVYIAGLTIAARKESAGGSPGRWPIILVFAPVGLWFAIWRGGLALGDLPFWTFAFPALFLAWCGIGVQTLKSGAPGRIGAAVAQFLAGISLLDAMAASLYNPAAAWFLLAGFVGALAFQRTIPAT